MKPLLMTRAIILGLLTAAIDCSWGSGYAAYLGYIVTYGTEAMREPARRRLLKLLGTIPAFQEWLAEDLEEQS